MANKKDRKSQDRPLTYEERRISHKNGTQRIAVKDSFNLGRANSSGELNGRGNVVTSRQRIGALTTFNVPTGTRVQRVYINQLVYPTTVQVDRYWESGLGRRISEHENGILGILSDNATLLVSGNRIKR